MTSRCDVLSTPCDMVPHAETGPIQLSKEIAESDSDILAKGISPQSNSSLVKFWISNALGYGCLGVVAE